VPAALGLGRDHPTRPTATLHDDQAGRYGHHEQQNQQYDKGVHARSLAGRDGLETLTAGQARRAMQCICATKKSVRKAVKSR
jgi:hypothetical protein